MNADPVLRDLLRQIKAGIARIEARQLEAPRSRPEGDTLARLLDWVAEQGCWLSGDGRIGESDFARFLGWHVDTLRKLRDAGGSPEPVFIGGGGHRMTYYVEDCARWIDDRRGFPAD